MVEREIEIMKRALVLLVIGGAAMAQISPNAPKDQPVSVTDTQLAAMDTAIAPYVKQARQTYPSAKARYLQGLPQGQIFFVTIALKDAKGKSERVFMRVLDIKGSAISGRIASPILLVEGFKNGQAYSTDEADVMDWLIAKSDGTEEGNVVGKFLDTYHP